VPKPVPQASESGSFDSRLVAVFVVGIHTP
jgi:hypothetical protein